MTQPVLENPNMSHDVENETHFDERVTDGENVSKWLPNPDSRPESGIVLLKFQVPIYMMGWNIHARSRFFVHSSDFCHYHKIVNSIALLLNQLVEYLENLRS